jgi:phenylalanyl-tRNA synthetase beta chain
MKVSLSTAQQYSNVDLKGISHDVLLKRIGAQLGAVEDTTDWTTKLKGAVIARVVTCEKHPNADKLSICRIDDGGIKPDVQRGDDNLIQVVCGAPNVRAGMFVVWLAPGVVVPNTRDTDPFVLEAREIRGTLSNGMLASASELGIYEDHTGILEINPDEIGTEPKLGDPLKNYFDLDDFVIDCENKMFTHRPDCFGILGVARELAGISGLAFKSPSWYVTSPKFKEHKDLPLLVKNDIKELVPRFTAVVMKDVVVAPSPIWLQAFLTRVGIKPINNVVDVTNYVMQLTGQPLHAFDYDKLKGTAKRPVLQPRKSKKGEKLTLLGQKEIELTGEEIVIATDKRAVALAGVMGGADTEIDDQTKNIVIEAATFDMYSIRRTSMRYGLFTDAVTRFNKGQSPLQNDRALAFALEHMHTLARASQASPVFDIKTEALPKKPLIVTAHYINDRLGTEMRPTDIATYLHNVEFETDITDTSDGVKIAITVPFWRMDIEQPEDIVEEIGRLHGFDKLPIRLPMRSAKPTAKNALFTYKQNLRQILKEAGANEVLTYSFVHGDLLQKTGVDPTKSAYHIRNAISPELQYYRTGLTPSLLAKIHPNIKAQAGDDTNIFAIYEIGKVYSKTKESKAVPLGKERLAFVIAADDKTARQRTHGSAFYHAKKYLNLLTNNQGTYTPLSKPGDQLTTSYLPGRSALVKLGETVIGVIGEFKPEIRRSLKLPDYSAGFEIDISLLHTNLKPQKYYSISSFPRVTQDITMEVTDASVGAVENELQKALKQVLPKDITLVDNAVKQLYQAEGELAVRMTYSFSFESNNRTLKSDEVNQWLDAAAALVAKICSAKRV